MNPYQYTRPPRPSGSTTGFWVLLALLVGAIAAIGTVVFLRQQDEAATPTATAPVATPAPAAPAATAPPASLTIAPLATVTLPAIGQPLPSHGVVPPAQTSYVFGYRRYDTAASDSGYIEHMIQYQPVDDTTSVITNGTAQPVLMMTFFRTEVRDVWYPDGTWERMPRSATSLAREPDFWMSKRLTFDDVVPPVALPFTTVTSAAPAPGLPWFVVRAQFDIAAFAAQHPDEHAAWLYQWASLSPFEPGLVDPAGRQVATENQPHVEGSIAPQPPGPDLAIPADVPSVEITFDANGLVEQAVIVDPVDNFRATYNYFGELDDVTPGDPTSGPGTGLTWVDAPA